MKAWAAAHCKLGWMCQEVSPTMGIQRRKGMLGHQTVRAAQAQAVLWTSSPPAQGEAQIDPGRMPLPPRLCATMQHCLPTSPKLPPAEERLLSLSHRRMPYLLLSTPPGASLMVAVVGALWREGCLLGKAGACSSVLASIPPMPSNQGGFFTPPIYRSFFLHLLLWWHSSGQKHMVSLSVGCLWCVTFPESNTTLPTGWNVSTAPGYSPGAPCQLCLMPCPYAVLVEQAQAFYQDSGSFSTPGERKLPRLVPTPPPIWQSYHIYKT